MLTNPHRTSGIIIVAAIVIVILLALTGCTGGGSSPAEEAMKAREQGVAQIRANQPVHPMGYSPTLDNINHWADTWGQEGKVSYVYMQRADGTFAGYYVLKGLPVNYCVSGSPTYDMEDLPDDGSSYARMVKAPGLDGAYYGGCDPSRYYGFDAVTGQYIEYTDGMVLTAVVSDQPLPLSKQPIPFGSSIADVKKAGG